MHTRRGGKVHRCDWCDRRIKIGERYSIVSYHTGGSRDRIYAHKECRAAWVDCAIAEHMTVYAYGDNERPMKEALNMKCDTCHHMRYHQSCAGIGGSGDEYCDQGHWDGCPFDQRPTEWPCQDYMGGRDSAIKGSGMCTHPECQPGDPWANCPDYMDDTPLIDGSVAALLEDA